MASAADGASSAGGAAGAAAGAACGAAQAGGAGGQAGLHGASHEAFCGAQAGLHGAAQLGAFGAQAALAGAAQDGLAVQHLLQLWLTRQSLPRSSFGSLSFGRHSFGRHGFGKFSFGRQIRGRPQSPASADAVSIETTATHAAVKTSFFISKSPLRGKRGGAFNFRLLKSTTHRARDNDDFENRAGNTSRKVAHHEHVALAGSSWSAARMTGPESVDLYDVPEALNASAFNSVR